MTTTLAIDEIVKYSRAASDKVRQLAEEVTKERFRQIRKWGPQTHPSGTGPDAVMAGRTMASYATILKAWNDRQSVEGGSAWAPILLEEIFEAMESGDLAHVREELIQSMAVIAAWIEDIDIKGEL
jgi:hypothetical protein